MSRSPRVRSGGRRRVSALACTLAVLLAGCGSGTEPASTGRGEETGGASPTGAVPTGATASCDNAYFPVVEGASWKYVVDASGGLGSTYEDTITKVTDGGFTVETDFQGLTREAAWSCTQDGLVSLAYGGGPSVSLTILGSESSFETSDVTGVTIPADVAPGDTWAQSFTIHGEGFVSDEVTAVTDGSVRIAFEAIEFEDVTVPAGTFPALEVAIRVRTNITVDLGTGATPVRTTVTGSSWFAEGVGMVKASNQGDVAGTIVTSRTVLEEYGGV